MNPGSRDQDRAIIHAIRRSAPGVLWPLVIALFAPAVVAASAAILLGLLGVFVIWLCIVAALVGAIVVADLAHRSMRRLAGASAGTLERRAVGVAGR